MTFYVILLLAAVTAMAATVHSLRHDGPTSPPLSHGVDPDFVAPGARSAYGVGDRSA